MKTRSVSFTLLLTLLYVLTARSENLKITKLISNSKNHSDELTSKKIYLKAQEDNISIEFQPDSLVQNYQYQLEGYDMQFNTTNYPLARYTGLPGGSYEFRVWCNNDSIKYEKLDIVIESRLTETSWFYPLIVACIFIILGTVAMFWVMYNYRQKLRLEAIRNKIASDLHDEVGATLSSISLSIRTIKRRLGEKAPEVDDILNKITSAADETGHNLRDTVWTINPENDTLDKIFDRVRSFALTILMAQDIVLHFKNEIDMSKNIKISMEQRRNIYLIIKEAINNIAKHSKAQNAWIVITQETDGIRMIIKDDGVGFVMNEQFDGNGLKNFKKRAAESFVDFNMTSIPSQGTTISMLIPEI